MRQYISGPVYNHLCSLSDRNIRQSRNTALSGGDYVAVTDCKDCLSWLPETLSGGCPPALKSHG